jgi:hypothetical protein
MYAGNLPAFTAEASLYSTSGHYRASYRAPGLPGHTIGTIRLSEIDVPGEVIEIEDDAPWWPAPWGGHTGPGTTGGGEPGSGEPGGGGAGGGTPSDTNPKGPPDSPGCSTRQVQSAPAGPCIHQRESDLMNGVKSPHYLRCTGEKMQCCQGRGKHAVCTDL